MEYSIMVTGIFGAIVGGFLTATVTALMNKRNEKEQRIFNARLDAYKEFAAHLESRFVSLTRDRKDLDIITLAEASAECLLVSSSSLNKELKAFLVYVSEVYKKSLALDKTNNNKPMFDKLWSDADRIENLMREDLGFELDPKN